MRFKLYRNSPLLSCSWYNNEKQMIQKNILLLTTIFSLFLSISAFAENNIDWQVISAGGSAGTSAIYQLNGTVGQSITGNVSSTNYGINQGYWQNFVTGSEFVCGDADGSEAVDISDAVYLIAYIFGGGPAPNPLTAADPDCSGAVDISDAVYLIAFIFSGGPAPCAGCP